MFHRKPAQELERTTVAESGSENFVSNSAIKVVALWFPRRERAPATSLFNLGSNIVAIIAPAIVPRT
ncbi:MAG: hypothetical protein WCL08_04650 [Verrucomicrobiota bacterium]